MEQQKREQIKKFSKISNFQFETDKDKLEIKKEAKELLEKFSKTLEKVKIKGKEVKEEFGGMREEGEGLVGIMISGRGSLRMLPTRKEILF